MSLHFLFQTVIVRSKHCFICISLNFIAEQTYLILIPTRNLFSQMQLHTFVRHTHGARYRQQGKHHKQQTKAAENHQTTIYLQQTHVYKVFGKSKRLCIHSC